MDKVTIEKAVRDILIAIGENPDRPGLVETPQRVARMLEEIAMGLKHDPREQIKLFDEPNSNEMVIVKDIEFYSLCEHHLLPFIGKANVAYIPRDGKVFGLSKIARIADTLARKPQTQERLTTEIADTILEAANPLGVLVMLEAEHLCMTMRGIKKPGSKTVTSAVRGIFQSDISTRTEALALMGR